VQIAQHQVRRVAHLTRRTLQFQTVLFSMTLGATSGEPAWKRP
jgi:hypothetical protein